MTYQSDINDNKRLLTAVNRHSDNYSSVESLEHELLLVSGLISAFLQQADFSTLPEFSVNKRDLLELIEMKRRLTETTMKQRDQLFRHRMMVQASMNEDLNYKKEISHCISNFFDLLQKYIPDDKLDGAIAELNATFKIS